MLERKEINKALTAAGKLVAASARTLIRTTAGQGRKYGGHVAGKPGQSPVNRTGQLAKDIGIESVRKFLAIRVVDKAFYAVALEDGAVGGGGQKGGRNARTSHKRGGRVTQASTARVLQPRPFLSVALDSRRAEITRRLQDAIQRDVLFKETK